MLKIRPDRDPGVARVDDSRLFAVPNLGQLTYTDTLSQLILF